MAGKSRKKQKSNIRKVLVDKYCDGELLFADGFDEAIIGVTSCLSACRTNVVCYDYAKCIDLLMEGDLSYTEAVEYMDFNVTGAFVGDRTPVFIETI